MTQTWLWIGVIGMALGSAFFGLGAHNAKKESWYLSTPLLILDLTFLGRTSLPITASLLGANAYMIVTGFVATISANRSVGHIWYVVSCFAFLATAYLLVNQYRKEAERKHPRAKKVFRKLLAVHLVFWTAYPIVWLLGNTWLNLINQGTETMFYTILDLASKVGFGFLSLNSLHNLEQAGEAPTAEGYGSTV